MRYTGLFSIVLLLIFQSCKVQPKAMAGNANIPAETGVSFNSICCGVRSDDFLRTFTENFRKKKKVTLPAFKITDCGKEGEFKVVFRTADLSAEVYNSFSVALRSAVEDETKKNKDSEHGTLAIETGDSISISHCRGGKVDF